MQTKNKQTLEKNGTIAICVSACQSSVFKSTPESDIRQKIPEIAARFLLARLTDLFSLSLISVIALNYFLYERVSQQQPLVMCRLASFSRCLLVYYSTFRQQYYYTVRHYHLIHNIIAANYVCSASWFFMLFVDFVAPLGSSITLSISF